MNASEILGYKFVINIHGNGNEWSNRFRMLLSSGALVFKQVGGVGTRCLRVLCVRACGRAAGHLSPHLRKEILASSVLHPHHSPSNLVCFSHSVPCRRQESTLFEFWERDLEPYQHYIPVKADFSDLVEKVEWAIAHDDHARAIAQNGTRFVRAHLHMTRVHCYWARLLSRYSALQDFKPQVPPEAVAVVNLASSLWHPSPGGRRRAE